ncbi:MULTISPECIES: hypothetical protein [unclassified Spirosoma]|uniref:hypothetical protein n=1 Tax=unclassified Spirosoma TaxID=2621999 RepID=UPI000966F576|nr:MULTISPECIES: hypothetical protein [unclassified Spirosoma]MBN8826815.1 hypothetical protein [Spirosoma sp.]OJW73613.1 MAG: hypothetical protein BGO59_19695 [Spirosoma sp. 48-14]
MKQLLLPSAVFLGALWPVYGSFYEAIAVGFSAYTFQCFFNQVGKRIAILECIGAIAAFEVLFIPAVTYWVFAASMPIESATYFSYATPACMLFYIGINGTETSESEPTHQTIIRWASNYVQHRQAAAGMLFFVGLIGFLVKQFWADAPTFMGTLPMNCLLTSVLYAHYTRSLFRLPLIGLVVTIWLANMIQTGMFGELVFWLLLWLLIGSVGLTRSLTASAKLGALGFGLGALLLIQSIKGEYRSQTWGYWRTERSADAGLMIDLVADRLVHPDKLLNIAQLFRSSVRFNQGILIGSAMAKVPTYEEYARGEVLLSFVYPFVPRFLWPDKPLAGGFANIKRFTTLPQLENTSMNLSPIGEGYVNFGYGGVLFAWLYGAVLRNCFRAVIQMATQVPSVVLWLPTLFVGCMTMETDVFSTWGSLLNSAVFIIILYGVFKPIGVNL